MRAASLRARISRLAARCAGALVVVTVFLAMASAARAQPDLCAPLPAGPLHRVGDETIQPITQPDDIDRGAGITAECLKSYENPPFMALALYGFDSLEHAKSLFDKPEPPYLERRASDLGDTGVEEFEIGAAPGASRFYSLVFRRGCYEFQGALSDRLAVGGTAIPDAWQPVPQSTIDVIRSAGAQADALFKTLPACGDSAAPPPPPSLGASLGLACDTAALQSDGAAVCTAGMGDATGAVTYAWTLDGKPQATSGDQLSLTGLAPGPHSVSVSARDSAGVEQGPQSTSFTRMSGLGVGIALPPLPPGVIPAILVVGGAVGTTIAIGVLVARGRRPRGQCGRRRSPGRRQCRW